MFAQPAAGIKRCHHPIILTSPPRLLRTNQSMAEHLPLIRMDGIRLLGMCHKYALVLFILRRVPTRIPPLRQSVLCKHKL